MKQRKLRVPILTAIIAIVLVGAVAVRRVSAQSSANPTLLQMVQDLARVVAGLVTTTEAIETTVQTLATPNSTNVRFTPPIFLGDAAGILCAVSNVGDVEHQVRVEAIAGFGGAATMDFTITLKPGEASAGSGGPPRGTYYCRFTVLDGVRSDIRGSAQSIGANPNLILAAE